MKKNRKEFLICVDSDGCAIDTMDIEHHQCFGPLVIEEWGLEQWREELLERWNEINLYSKTRGINRFQGLSQILGEVHQTRQKINGLEMYQQWIRQTKELSQPELLRYAEEMGRENGICLWKALSWSKKVNEAVNQISDQEKRAFSGVLEALKKASTLADLVVVSSANRQAVLQEWEQNELAQYVSLFFAQEAGTKSHCIGKLKSKYASDKILFVGDAVGDLRAARENQILFYPILAGQEEVSWKKFEQTMELFFSGCYGGEIQKQQMRCFWSNFKE